MKKLLTFLILITYFSGINIFGQVTCTKPGKSDGNALASNLGISLKGYLPTVEGWPESVPNGYLVLDSDNKGLVITHVNNSQRDELEAIEGMLIYNTEENCVQLYRGNTPGLSIERKGWNCIEESCNDTNLKKVRFGYWGERSIGDITSRHGNINSDVSHRIYRSQLENPYNYGPHGTFKGILKFEFIDITNTLSEMSAQELKDNFDIIAVGFIPNYQEWKNSIQISSSDAQKVKEFCDLGGVVFGMHDKSLGDPLRHAFGGNGNTGSGNFNANTNSNALNNGIFGDARSVLISGNGTKGRITTSKLPPGSIILGTENDHPAIWLSGPDYRAIFVWDEGLFAPQTHLFEYMTDNPNIETDQEVFIHNLMAYALEKAGFSPDGQ